MVRVVRDLSAQIFCQVVDLSVPLLNSFDMEHSRPEPSIVLWSIQFIGNFVDQLVNLIVCLLEQTLSLLLFLRRGKAMISLLFDFFEIRLNLRREGGHETEFRV